MAPRAYCNWAKGERKKKIPTLRLKQHASRGFLDSTLMLLLCDSEIQENVKGPTQQKKIR